MINDTAEKKMRPINALSLFDGMGCGWITLKNLGVPINKAYASEIEKNCIATVKHNFPDVIHLGSVTDVDVSTLEPIDLLIGGSPCQSFSFAGKMNGMTTTQNEEILSLERYLELKNNGFSFEGQSYLFWEYIRILRDIQKYNPKILFFLENVKMAKKWESLITETIGINPVLINSALVSAQNRQRLYWTNIYVSQDLMGGGVTNAIPQPADRGILLKDILEQNVDPKFYLSEKVVDNLIAHALRNKELGNHFGAKFHEGGGKMGCISVKGKGMYDLVKT